MEQATPQQPQQPQAPQTNDEAIGDYARGFLADLQANDDPDQMTPLEDAPVEQEQHQEETQGDQSEETEGAESETATQQPEVEMVEVEKDGKKFHIPAELKGDFMAKKDYSQKTAVVAEKGRALDQIMVSAQQVATQASQMAPLYAQLFAMDSRSQQLMAALTPEFRANDPIEFNNTQGELALLLRNRDQFAAQLGNAQQGIDQQFRAVQAQRLALEAPALFEEFPALKEEGTRQNLVKFLREQGADDQALGYIDFSIVGTKLAYKAMQYDRMVADQAKSKAKLAEKVKAAPPVATNSRVPNVNAQEKQLQKDWKKSGGKLHDPAFSALLRNKLRGK